MRISIAVFGISTLVSAVQGALLGFDYGQEFSKAMLVSPHAPLELVLTADSKRKDVSGLALKSWKSDIERIYGSGVHSAQVKNPKSALLHVKSLLGKTIDEHFSLYHKAHPGVVFSSTQRDSVAIKSLDHAYPVEEILAMNLDETITRANAMLLRDKSAMDTVDSIAITVPEFFTQNQRLALSAAAELPRNIKAHLVNDGMTVAIDFALKQRNFPAGEKHHYVFYDMGSGSTRASLISIEQPKNLSEPLIVEFNGYGYDNGLGGTQFTQNIAELIKNKFLEQHQGIRTETLEMDARALVRIHQAAEKAKLILSANADASVNIESLHADVDFKATITRQEFEDFSEDLTSRITLPILNALDNQFFSTQISLKDIKSLILTGGSTRTPMVQRQLADYFGDELIAKNVNADESSVNGVTIRGIQLFKSFQTKALNVVDRSIFSYSAAFNDSGLPVELFERGSEYPNRTSYLISPQMNVSSFSIDLQENGEIFKSHLVDTEPIAQKFSEEACPYGIAYNATFSLSQDRLFDLDIVEAICVQNSKSASGLIQKLFAGSNPEENNYVTEDDKSKDKTNDKIKRLKTKEVYSQLKPITPVERLVLKDHMEDMNERDAKRLEIQEKINALESTLYETRSYLEEEDVISNGPQQEVEALNELVNAYLEWLDYESDDASIKDLTERSRKVSSLKERIELYVDSVDEPLNLSQFSQFYANGTDLIRQLEEYRSTENTTLEALRESFAEVDLDVVKEFKKLKAPRHLSLPGYKIKDAVRDMENALGDVNKILNDDTFSAATRENLFALKLQFDSCFTELNRCLELEQSIQKFKLNELVSLFSRRQRVIKKREERRKNQESSILEKDSNSTLTHSSQESSTTTPLEHDEL
ncbi:LANO_0E13542g1_1 [Lachancea nothofagi CBS 11611]|uniref:LANO_0E13542g1_1 n=1 Tax=Lachancea nothofagi CBS 11611 TaxID=1266666 RepID=A0A1G4JZ26_9SACH|nr:LANO_0E13542g1_1 [Lachancea nothofagi CBS 11611]